VEKDKEMKEEKVSFWCRLGLHRWGKWSETRPSAKFEYLLLLVQSRKCINCHLYQERVVLLD